MSKDLYDYITEPANDFLPTRIEPSLYDGTKFYFLHHAGTKTRGKTGADFAKKLAIRNCVDVNPATNPTFNIGGNLVQYKTAMMDDEGGFTVNQIRPKQDFGYIVLIAISPTDAEIFTIPKEVILSLSTPQHGGKDSKETYMYVAKDMSELLADFGEFLGKENYLKLRFPPIK